MSKLLDSQVQRHLPNLSEAEKIRLSDFLMAVDQAYKDSESDREMLERSLEISSKEMVQKNRKLQEEIEKLEKKIDDLRDEVSDRFDSLEDELMAVKNSVASIESKIAQMETILYKLQDGLDKVRQLGEANAEDIARQQGTLDDLKGQLAQAASRPKSNGFIGTVSNAIGGLIAGYQV